MYQILLFCHSYLRWLVVASLLYAIFRAYKGYTRKVGFSKLDDTVRHTTATVAQVQLMVGLTLYLQSPIVSYFWKHFKAEVANIDLAFFGLIHILLMFVAVSVISVGSSLAKRQAGDQDKFRTVLVYFGIALFIIFMAIPWPFSPLAARPYLRLL